jgi:hypothetical protein
MIKCEEGQSELTALSTVLHVEKMLEKSTQKAFFLVISCMNLRNL